MFNNYKIVKQEEKKNIKIVDNKNEFYLDIDGKKIEGIKKYRIIKEENQAPVLEFQLYLDNIDFEEFLESKTY